MFIKACHVGKRYGNNAVLSDVSFNLEQGEIVGLIGPNGAGKSTLLKAIMGLVNYSGDLTVFGQNPFKQRHHLLQNMSYVADVASLPIWMKVSDCLAFVARVHPKFDINHAKQLLTDTTINDNALIGTLSKGMKTRLHLSIILSIQTDLLVLDEPTLGLDVLVRRDFQDRLVQDYYNQQRSILITTHQIDEVQNILTRVLFIKEGRITLDMQTDELKTRFQKLTLPNNQVPENLSKQAIYQRALPDCHELIFENTDTSQLAQHGALSTPSLEDLFVATNAASYGGAV